MELIQSSIANTKASLWPAFAPEIIVALTIMTILLVRCFTWATALQKIDSLVLTLIGTGWAFYHIYPGSEHYGEKFGGMIVLDNFTVFIRGILLGFTFLFAILTWLTNSPDREDGADFFSLILGGILGMSLMASANHLLMVFLAVEMASVPSYALAGILRNRRDSSEAALKYSVYGAGAAGIMLYGISLLAGLFNTVHLPTMAQVMSVELATMNNAELLVAGLAGVMVMAGLAFKLSAVPFHFWCPDVFTGASAEVNAFLSVASKAGALALLVRVAIGLGTLGGAQVPTSDMAAHGSEEQLLVATPANPASVVTQLTAAQDASQAEATSIAQDEAGSVKAEPLSSVRTFIAFLVGVIAAVTSTFGNLAAYGQTNIKRLMAYSTIAHAGYMMLPIPAAMLAAGVDREVAQQAISGLAFYMFIYLFMNLGAFAVIAFLRNSLGTEEIADLGGLIKFSPVVVVLMAGVLFSLVGLPPMAGFWGKMLIFASLVGSYQATGQSFLMVLLIIGGLNTAISLYYYLRVVKVMTIDPETEVVRSAGATLGFLRGVYVTAVILPVFVFGIYWDQIHRLTQAATAQLF